MLTKNDRDVKSLNLNLLEPDTHGDQQPTPTPGNNSPTGSGGNNNNNSPTGTRSSFPAHCNTQEGKLQYLRVRFKEKDFQLADWMALSDDDQLAVFGALCGDSLETVERCVKESHPRLVAGRVFCMSFNHKAAPPPVPQPEPERAKAAEAGEPDFSYENAQFWEQALLPPYAMPSGVKLDGNYRDEYMVTRDRFFANYQLHESEIRTANLKADLDKMMRSLNLARGVKPEFVQHLVPRPQTILDTDLNRLALKQGKEHAKFTDKYMNKDKEKKKANLFKGKRNRDEGKSKSGKYCDHCRKGGHTTDECYIKHPEKRHKKSAPATGNAG